ALTGRREVDRSSGSGSPIPFLYWPCLNLPAGCAAVGVSGIGSAAVGMGATGSGVGGLTRRSRPARNWQAKDLAPWMSAFGSRESGERSLTIAPTVSPA